MAPRGRTCTTSVKRSWACRGRACRRAWNSSARALSRPCRSYRNSVLAPAAAHLRVARRRSLEWGTGRGGGMGHAGARPSACCAAKSMVASAWSRHGGTGSTPHGA
eukprot:363159-Chlamydomonas_euryale.AAC.5